MFRDEKLELKVGLFMGVGLFLMFLIVFSIKDVNTLKKGYDIRVKFDFVNGLSESAPARLAGVDVGEVRAIGIYYDEELKRTRVNLNVKIFGDVRIEKDAIARINTLGLLGEQYLEITPGSTSEFLADKDILEGHNPVNVGQQMEQVAELVSQISGMFQRVGRGEGTIGKLMTDDTLYNDISAIFSRLSKGEGTIGKLLVEEKIYNDLEAFVADIKAHPWKLLSKPSRSETDKGTTKKRGSSVDKK